jgi:hypothetical protein
MVFVKHAFRDAGMWPVDFKAVQQKIIEYGKKQKQRQQQQAQKEWEGLECVTGPRNNSNYDLPELLPPQSYAECQAAITSIQGKIHDLLLLHHVTDIPTLSNLRRSI